jgi:tRNA (guanine10-N2)-methyltransferase
MPLYLIYFAQIHPNFRSAEIEALADLEGIQYAWEGADDPTSPFVKIHLASHEVASQLIKRSILAKAIYLLIEEDSTYDGIAAKVKSNKDFFVSTCAYFALITCDYNLMQYILIELNLLNL